MKTRNIASCLGVLSACFAISSPAVAEDNCWSISIEVGGGAIVNISDDRTRASRAISGRCAPTGPFSNECTFKDEDGDQWTTAAEWTGSGLKGKWRAVSGTGKYANNSGDRGWFKRLRTMFSPRGEAVLITDVGGYCALADKNNK